MEIEKKFLIPKLPENYSSYPHHQIEQGYLCTDPALRIRKEDDVYYLTYKSKGLMVREEYNLPLNKDSYYHLRKKSDGCLITKTRYLIPYQQYTIELDVFQGFHKGLLLAEVEFPTPEDAESFSPPPWFGEDVTLSGKYHNSNMINADCSQNGERY